MNWQFLDTLLTRLRPHREALALLLDVLVVAVAWQATYLFRLGFERWFAARPDYDGWVLLGLLAIYAAVLWALRVPKGMWRFSGFGEVKRLAVACLLAGLIGLYLGWIWLASGNLLTPMVTHGVYDFLALAYLVKVRGGRGTKDEA